MRHRMTTKNFRQMTRTVLPLFLMLSLLGGTLQTTAVQVYAAEPGNEADSGNTEQTAGSSEETQSVEGKKGVTGTDPAGANAAGTGSGEGDGATPQGNAPADDGNGSVEGVTPQENAPADDGNDSTGGNTGESDALQEDRGTTEETDGEGITIGDESTGTTTEEEAAIEEEIIVHEETGFETMEAMMAGASSTASGYDPTSLYAHVEPAPRGYKVSEQGGVPPEKTAATKSMSQSLSDIWQWDIICFGKPAGQKDSLYYDYGENNVWISDYIRWRVLDTERDNRALNIVKGKNDYDDTTAEYQEAMFVMAEGLFGDRQSAGYGVSSVQNWDKVFGNNKDAVSNFATTSALENQWCTQFPLNNFSPVEQNAVREISKLENGSITNTVPHSEKTTEFNDTDSGANINGYPVISRKTRVHPKADISGLKVFSLSASEALYPGYGFAGNGTANDACLGSKGEEFGVNDGKPYDADPNLNSGYKIIYKGLAYEQNDYDPAMWDSRVLPWKGYRHRGENRYPRYAYGNSVSWRLRNIFDGDKVSIVSGMNTSWYGTTGAVTAVGVTNPVAFRPGMNLEKNKILFISEAENGKNERNENGGWLDLGNQAPDVITEYKLTLYDENRSGFHAEIENVEGDRYIAYSNALPANGSDNPSGEYISVLIKDNNGDTLWYGRIAQTDASGSGRIPISVLGDHWKKGLAYQLYVFAEQHNGARETDYSSQIEKISDVDEVFAASTDELHWTIDPDDFSPEPMSLTIANSSEVSDISISDVEVTGNYRIVGEELTVVPQKGYITVTIEPTGSSEQYPAGSRPPDGTLTVQAAGLDAITVDLTCTVLRNRYHIIPAEEEIETKYFGVIDPEAIPAGTAAFPVVFTNAGRQDLFLTATLSGDHSGKFSVSESATLLLQAAPIGAENKSHTFTITSNSGSEEIPEGLHTIYLDVTAEPRVSTNTIIPAEERPDEYPFVSQTFRIPLQFKISPKGYRVEFVDPEVADISNPAWEMDPFEPEEDINTPERDEVIPKKEFVFRNTGRYPVSMTVDALTEAEQPFFKIISVTGNGTSYDAGDEIPVAVDQEIAVQVAAIKTEVHARSEEIYQLREMNLSVHAMHPEESGFGEFREDLSVAVSYKMYPKALEWKASPQIVNFGSIVPENMASASGMTVAITNTGRETVTLSNLMIGGEGRAAFRFEKTPRNINPIEPGETIEEAVKLYSGMDENVEYLAEIQARVNGSAEREKICDLRVFSGKPDYEITPRTKVVDFRMDPDKMQQARVEITVENTGKKAVTITGVEIVGDTERFEVSGLKNGTKINEKGRLDFYIKPNSTGVEIGQEFSATLRLLTNPADAFVGTIPLNMYMDQRLFFMNQEEPKGSEPLKLDTIEPEHFAETAKAKTIRFANTGRGEINITDVSFENSIETYFARSVFIVDEEHNRTSYDLGGNVTEVALPSGQYLEIDVIPTEAIREKAGSDENVKGKIFITTDQESLNKEVEVEVFVERFPYDVRSDKQTLALGDFYPEDYEGNDGPSGQITFTNLGREDVYLPAPEVEQGKEGFIRVKSVEIIEKGQESGTVYENPQEAMLLKKDGSAVITLGAVKQPWQGEQPDQKSVDITVYSVINPEAEPLKADDNLAVSPVVLQTGYNMYAPKYQVESTPDAVTFTENVEPYKLEEVPAQTITIRNLGRSTLVPGGGGSAFEIKNDYFSAENFRVNGEVYDEEHPFLPGTTLTFDIRPKENDEEAVVYDETLALALQTAETETGTTPVKETVTINAHIEVPLPKERIQSVPEDVKVDFGILAPIGEYQQPAAKSVTIKNTGREPVEISRVYLDGTNADKFEDVVYTKVTLGADPAQAEPVSTVVQVQPKEDVPEGVYTATLKAETGMTEEAVVTLGTVTFEVGKRDHHVIAYDEQTKLTWKGTLDPMLAVPEEAPQVQKITLKNIGKQPVSVTNLMLTEGSDHFRLAGSSVNLPTQLLPDATMTVSVQPYDLLPEGDYSAKLKVSTDPTGAAFNVQMNLSVPKIPYDLIQDHTSFTFEAVDPDASGAYQPVPQTVTLDNKGRKTVEITGFVFDEEGDDRFRIDSVICRKAVVDPENNTVNYQDVTIDLSAVSEVHPLPFEPDTALKITLSPKDTIKDEPGNHYKDQLQIKIKDAVTEDRTVDLDVTVNKRAYDLALTEQGKTDLGNYYPEQDAPETVHTFKNTGVNAVYLKGVLATGGAANVTTDVTIGGKPYHDVLNYTVSPGQEVTVKIKAVEQSTDRTVSKVISDSVSVVATKSEGGNDATAHTQHEIQVSFNMFAYPHVVETSTVADFGDVGHEALDKAPAQEIKFTNLGRETLEPVGDSFVVENKAGDASVFTFGEGTIDGQVYDPVSNAFAPGKELVFTVKPKPERVSENAAYEENVTVSFAAKTQGETEKTVKTTAKATVKINVLTTAHRLESDRANIDFGVKTQDEELPAAETIRLTNTGRESLTGILVSVVDSKRISTTGGADETLTNPAFTVTGGTLTVAASGHADYTVEPALTLPSNETPEGVYTAKLVFTTNEITTPQELATLTFCVGIRPYYVTSGRASVAFEESGALITPETAVSAISPETVVLSNFGANDAEIASLELVGGDADGFTLAKNPDVTEIPKRDAENPTVHQLKVSIRPAMAALEPNRTYRTTLVVTFPNDYNHPAIRIPVTMEIDNSKYAADVSAPDAFAFASVDPDHPEILPEGQQITITNTGKEALKPTCDLTGTQVSYFESVITVDGQPYDPDNGLHAGKTAVITVTPKEGTTNGIPGFVPNTQYTTQVKVTVTGTDGSEVYVSEVPASYKVLRTEKELKAKETNIGFSDVDPDKTFVSESRTIRVENTGRIPLTIISAELDGEGKGAFEIVETDLKATRLAAPDTDPVGAIMLFHVRTKDGLEENKEYKAQVKVETVEGTEETVNLSLSVLRKSYTIACEPENGEVVFGNTNDPQPTGIEPENVLTDTETLKVTNRGRDAVKITNAWFKGRNKAAFTTPQIPADGITLSSANMTAGEHDHIFQIGLTDDEDEKVTQREKFTYEATLVIDLLTGEDLATERTVEIPVTCYVKQKQYRIEARETALDLGIADYAYTNPEELNYQKTVTIRNTGREDVNITGFAFANALNAAEPVFGVSGATGTLAAGESMTVAVWPEHDKAAGSPEAEDVTEHKDSLIVTADTAAGTAVETRAEVHFRVRAPHYQIATDAAMINYGEIYADAAQETLNSLAKDVTVTNIGNIGTQIKAEADGNMIHLDDGTTDGAEFNLFAVEYVTPDTADPDVTGPVDRYGTTKIRIRPNAAPTDPLTGDLLVIPAGHYQVTLRLHALKAGDAQKLPQMTQEVLLHLWVKEAVDPTALPQIKTEVTATPGSVDLGEAYNDYSEVDSGTAPSGEIVLKNTGETKVKLSASITSGDQVFTLEPEKDFSAETAPEGERKLTVRLKEDPAMKPGSRIAIVTVTATDATDETRTATTQIPVMVRIVEIPVEEVKTFAVTTSVPEVVFKEINPLDPRPAAIPVRITNAGTGIIRINGISLQNEQKNDAAEAGLFEIKGVGDEAFAPVNLDPGAFSMIYVRPYAPSDPSAGYEPGTVCTAEILIETDRVGVQETLKTEFRVRNISNDITIDPAGPLDFGEREPGEPENLQVKNVSVINNGNMPVNLTGILEQAGDDNATEYVISDLKKNGTTVSVPQTGEEITLDPGDAFAFNIKPVDGLVSGNYAGKIAITTNISGMEIHVPISYVVKPSVTKWETKGKTDLGTVENTTENPYGEQPWETFEVKNTGNVPLDWKGVTAAEGGASWVEIDGLVKIGDAHYDKVPSVSKLVPVGETLVFKARPVTGKANGRYTEIIRVVIEDGTEEKYIEFPVRFRVKMPGDDVLSALPDQIAYTELAESDPLPEAQEITIHNHGTDPLTVETATLQGFAADAGGNKPFLLTDPEGNTLSVVGNTLDADGDVIFNIRANSAYTFEIDKTLIGTLQLSAKDANDEAYEVEIPLTIRKNTENYLLQTDQAVLNLGEAVPSDYKEVEPQTVIFTNESTHAADVTLPVPDSADAFEIVSYSVNGANVDLNGTQPIAGTLEPGQSAVAVITAKKGLAENTQYSTMVRIKAYKHGADPADPQTPQTQAAVQAVFSVSATPSDAYVINVTEEVTFEPIEPRTDPLEAVQIREMKNNPQTVTVKNAGTRDITVTDITLSGEEADARFRIGKFTYDGDESDAFSAKTLQPGETLTFTAAVQDAYAQFAEKKVYKSTVTVTTDRAGSREIPITFEVKEQLPAGIWMKAIPDQSYTGAQIKPAVEVYYGPKKLTTADYTVTYKNNTNAADKNAVNAKGASVAPSVIVKGKGTYAGQITETFTITPLDIRDAVIPMEDAVSKVNTDNGSTVHIRAVHLVMNQTAKAVAKVAITPTYALPTGKTVKLTAKDFSVDLKGAKLLLEDQDSNGNITKSWSPDAVEVKAAGIYKIPVKGLGNYGGKVLRAGDDPADNSAPVRYIYLEIVNTNKKLGAVETRTPISKMTIPTFPAQTFAWAGAGKEFVYLPAGMTEEEKNIYYNANGEVKEAYYALHYNDKKLGLQPYKTDVTDKVNKTKFGFAANGKQTVPYPMVLGQDYLVTYETNHRVGTAKITLTGIGDYYGSVTKTYKINGRALSNAQIVTMEGAVSKDPHLGTTGTFASILNEEGGEALYRDYYDQAKKAFWYTGEPYDIAGSTTGTDNGGIRLRFNNGTGTKTAPSFDELVKGTHYTVSYLNNTVPGTATVVFTGVEEYGYTGAVKKSFKIVGSLEQEEVVVRMMGELDDTKRGEDKGLPDVWTMSKNQSNGKMVQNDPGISRKAVKKYNNVTVNTVYSAYAYRKGGVKPEPVVTYRDEVLVKGVDYSLTWQNNNPGSVVQIDRTNMKIFKQPTVTVTGLGRFKGSKRVIKFDIYANNVQITKTTIDAATGEEIITTADPWTANLTFVAGDVVWKAAGASSTLKPVLTLTDTATGTALKGGTDYYLATDKAINANSSDAQKAKLLQYTYVSLPKLGGATYVERYDVTVSGKKKTINKKKTFKIKVAQGSVVSADGKGIVSGGFTYWDENAGRWLDEPAGGKLIGADDIIPAGTIIHVRVTGKGFYEGQTIESDFRYIETNAKNTAAPKVVQDISKMTVSIPNQAWTGKPVTLTADQIKVSVKVAKQVKDPKTGKMKNQTVTVVLEPGRDYEIVEGSFVNNINTGTAKVTIRGIYNNGRGASDLIGGIGGVKTVAFKIVARQMNYTLQYNDNATLRDAKGATVKDEAGNVMFSERFGKMVAEFVKQHGTDEEKALIEQARTENKPEYYYLGAYFRISGTMANSATSYGANLPANQYVVQRKVISYNKKKARVETWTTMDAKKGAAIIFSEWTLKPDDTAKTVVAADGTETILKEYESFINKDRFIFRKSAWYMEGDSYAGSLIGNWYRKLVYGDGITLYAQWEVK